MSVLNDWINPYYLKDSTIRAVREDLLAKPYAKYSVLDNFFLEEKLDQLIQNHSTLEFSEEKDRRSIENGEWLPYDGSVCWAEKDKHFGSELFFGTEWHHYLAEITDTKISIPTKTEVKLRTHRPLADGFWIHSDSFERRMVAICYFNKDWKKEDGGLLQLWKQEKTVDPMSPVINSPQGRMDFLNQNKRIRSNTIGGGVAGNRSCDFQLIDQIIPHYNRLFICNFQLYESLHSVSPSGNKTRTGFVQWML